ncbi:Histidine kinase [Sticta canariensis]|nr:Histidine kinase [Sticta canariensis]
MGQIKLGSTHPNGTPVYFGDDDLGYPPNLYPNLTYNSIVINSTFNESRAFFHGNRLYENSTLLLGPLLVNETFALISITMPIINNTSAADILGWLTVVTNANLIFEVEESVAGLGRTGEILIIGPDTPDSRLPLALQPNQSSEVNKTIAKQQNVKFVLPPLRNLSRSSRHATHTYGTPMAPFEMQRYAAVFDANTEQNNQIQNAGSLISSKNEEGQTVSVGFALAMSPMVDWTILFEQSHSEVIAPINRLRNVLVACVFGTTGVLLLLVFPIAHLSVLPIRRLQEATKKTVEPYRYPSDDGSIRSSLSEDDNDHGSEQGELAVEAKKEGFFGRLSNWRDGRRKTRTEGGEHMRRQSFRIPGKVRDRKHVVQDELTDLTKTFNEMSEELMMQYERLEERVRERTQELEISKKAAEAANESKTLFIANISHELKTPLNGIMGMTSLCLQEENLSEIKHSLRIIYKSGDLLLHLLTDLLTFSKNQIGQQLTLDEREFRLVDISSQILSIFDKQAKDGSINLKVKFQGPQDNLGINSGMQLQNGFGPYGTGRVKDMSVWGDQHRVLQVIINLVSNSLKFTPPNGSVEVRVRCVGEAEERAESRKGSMQSKQSRLSKQSRQQSSGSKKRGRVAADSRPSVSPAAKDREKARYSNTALQVNGKEPKVLPSVAIRERSSSPPPSNARTLIFEFEVEDTGPGIPESQQQRVFDPFMQGDLGLSKKYGGTGLGLSICSQLAGLMKGSIVLKSQEGVGSKFTMRIPMIFIKETAGSATSSIFNGNSQRNSMAITALKDEPQSPSRNRSTSDLSVKSTDGAPALGGFETPVKPRLVGLSQPFFAATSPLETSEKQLAAIERVAAQASRTGAKVRVLVAEDNQVNQEVVLRMLKLEDIYDVTIAKDGQEAFELVKQSMADRNLFNLIFMDVQMPILDGLQSTRLIREMGYSAPIVALTAFAEESNVKECMDSGMDFFLPKPIRRPALKQVLKRYCATIPEVVEEVEKDSGVAKDEAISPMS